MAKLTSSKRAKLPKSEFAEPGKRKYPVPDVKHARNALARVAQHGTPAEKKEVRAKVHREFPEVGMKEKKHEMKMGEKKPMHKAGEKKKPMHETKPVKRIRSKFAGGHDAIGAHPGYEMMHGKRGKK
jgi:hypothetical protein